MEIKELIICVAVRYKNKIWRGNRHNNAIDAMRDELSYTMNRKELAKISGDIEQGFITNNNRYVDRKEGKIIAVKAGQYRTGADVDKARNHYASDLLFSEDLY